MQRLFFTAILAVSAALAGCQKRDPYTENRLTPQAIEKMVEGPIGTVRKEGLASGQAQFRKLLTAKQERYGNGSVQVADLLTAFGVELYILAEDEAARKASVNSLREAIPHYRKAFGPDHPEVAVALHTLADAAIADDGSGSIVEAKAALEEALRIRRAALGSNNRETRATEKRLRTVNERQSKNWPRKSAGRALDAADDALDAAAIE